MQSSTLSRGIIQKNNKIMSKFKKGDQVRIEYVGYIYTTYSDMFTKMGFNNIQYNSDPTDINGPWTVFANPELHPNGTGGWLVPIENSAGDQCLIGEKGLVDTIEYQRTGTQLTTFVVTLLWMHRNGDFAIDSQKVVAVDMAQAFGLAYEISKDEYKDMALTSKTVIEV